MVDEKTLYDTFSRFGSLIVAPKIARDENSLSKGYGFVSYANFEASDDAIANMNGQFLMNKEISVQYAYKKDGKGERHGDQAERMLAAQAKQHGVVPDRQQLPPGLMMNGLIPTGPAGVLNGPQSTPMNGIAPPGGPMGFPQAGNFQNVPPPQQQRSAVLAPPPSGLPSRPPPSQAGYGGPQDFHPPGFGQAPPGFPPQMPPGFGPPPGQMGGMPQGMPPGFMPPPGFGPPQPPAGFGRR